MSEAISSDLNRLVRRRARRRCEYCQLPEGLGFITFHVDHCISQKHDGPTVAENLALACPACNAHKGSDIAGLDPEEDRPVALFNPRTQVWSEHFRQDDFLIVGLTATGRVTARLLRMNDADRILDRFDANRWNG
ncbi:HNH endonuclease [Alienimonas sp. DA493]|uniref:HNH endonuclease n=1 Tax=Alienimonas sp. DA493 TaxID=3373605 RepID=UPI003754C84A